MWPGGMNVSRDKDNWEQNCSPRVSYGLLRCNDTTDLPCWDPTFLSLHSLSVKENPTHSSQQFPPLNTGKQTAIIDFFSAEGERTTKHSPLTWPCRALVQQQVNRILCPCNFPSLAPVASLQTNEHWGILTVLDSRLRLSSCIVTRRAVDFSCFLRFVTEKAFFKSECWFLHRKFQQKKRLLTQTDFWE